MRDTQATTVTLDDTAHTVRVYRCSQSWSMLSSTERADVRFCDHCMQQVFLVNNVDDLAVAVSASRCISIHPGLGAKDRPIVGSLESDYAPGNTKLVWEDEA